MKIMKILAISAIAYLISANANAALLSAKITGFRNTVGQVVCQLFNSEQGYDNGVFVQDLKVAISGETTDVQFGAPVIDGEYAIQCFHDQDMNGEMKKNFLGMPREGVACSTNPSSMPTFQKIKFKVERNDVTLDMILRYLW
jgi:uncharacterized protein (DUF2141 family)